jgi:hypothetical protein
MMRLADKWQTVRGLEPDGVHQSWLFFGMFGSRAEELAYWAAYSNTPRDEFLMNMAIRDFGPDAANAAFEGWQAMSEAVGHIPCVTLRKYYIGPSFLGPCHPLVPSIGDPVPEVFSAVLFYLQEGEETFSRRSAEVRTCLVMNELPETAHSVNIDWEGGGDGWDIVIEEYRQAAEQAERSYRNLRSGLTLCRTEEDAIRLEEEANLAEIIHRTFVTCANTVDFLLERRKPGKSRTKRMLDLARHEMANAEASIRIYNENSWLDLSKRTDGIFSRCDDMLSVKIAWLKDFLDSTHRRPTSS